LEREAREREAREREEQEQDAVTGVFEPV